MSAWIVSRQHIDVLTKALLYDYKVVGDMPPTLLGRLLWQENLDSIHALYRDTAETHTDYPGPLDFHGPETVAAYEYVDPGQTVKVEDWRGPHDHAVSPALVCKAAHCYDYQTCEHDGYATSRVRRWIVALTEALHEWDDTSEYGAAPWGL